MKRGFDTRAGDHLGRTTQQRDDELYEYLVNYIDAHGWAPNQREIKEEIQMGGICMVATSLQRLKQRGLIDYRHGQARAIRILDRTRN